MAAGERGVSGFDYARPKLRARSVEKILGHRHNAGGEQGAEQNEYGTRKTVQMPLPSGQYDGNQGGVRQVADDVEHL